MKNKAFKNFAKLLVVVAGCLLFASFSPSLDGRAVVVDEGVFPQGLFAKTVGYLPGDTISVTNVAGDSTVDILVIGSLDASEGVAIMLTPEAADAIGINKDDNNIVKITKRSGLDERVYGNAIIAKSTEPLASENSEEEVEETPMEESFEEESTEEDVAEETTDSEVEEYTEDAVEEDSMEDEIVEETEEDFVEETVEEENPEEVEDAVEEEPTE